MNTANQCRITNALNKCLRHINACPAGKMTEIANVIYENIKSLDLNHCCDVTLLLKVLILFKESTVIQLILKRIHTVDS